MVEQPPAPGSKMEKINLRILCAEDEEFLRELLKHRLELRYVHVEIVENGALLMEKLTAPGASYDCVVTDHNMPEKKGLEAVREMRSMENLKNLPVIIYTTVDSPELNKEIMSLGAHILNKPAEAEQLYAAIDDAVESKK